VIAGHQRERTQPDLMEPATTACITAICRHPGPAVKGRRIRALRLAVAIATFHPGTIEDAAKILADLYSHPSGPGFWK
jgi:hypothetical protein